MMVVSSILIIIYLELLDTLSCTQSCFMHYNYKLSLARLAGPAGPLPEGGGLAPPMCSRAAGAMRCCAALTGLSVGGPTWDIGIERRFTEGHPFGHNFSVVSHW